jgi:ectoine hydroxylase-related dioxygenase (phytanoyl-CoA dioxygenase family)
VWTLPHTLWHADFSFALPAWPLAGVKMFTFLSDVPPHGGGTLVVTGSHELVRRFVAGRASEQLKRTRQTRLAFLASHPWLRELTSESRSDDRIARFMNEEQRIDGVAVRAVELTGRAGDVVLTHPWLLHCRAANRAAEPRFMRTIDIYRGGYPSTERLDPGPQGGEHFAAPG